MNVKLQVGWKREIVALITSGVERNWVSAHFSSQQDRACADPASCGSGNMLASLVAHEGPDSDVVCGLLSLSARLKSFSWQVGSQGVESQVPGTWTGWCWKWRAFPVPVSARGQALSWDLAGWRPCLRRQQSTGWPAPRAVKGEEMSTQDIAQSRTGKQSIIFVITYFC